MCLTLNRCRRNISVRPVSCFVDYLSPRKEKGPITIPRQCGEEYGLNTEAHFWASGPEPLKSMWFSPDCFLPLTSTGKWTVLPPQPLSCTPQCGFTLLSFAPSRTLLSISRYQLPPLQRVSGSSKATGYFLFWLQMLHRVFLQPKG